MSRIALSPPPHSKIKYPLLSPCYTCRIITSYQLTPFNPYRYSELKRAGLPVHLDSVEGSDGRGGVDSDSSVQVQEGLDTIHEEP